MEPVIVEQDTEAGALYFSLADAPVAATVHIDELVSVDVDARNQPVGVEVVLPVERVTLDRLSGVFARFPELKDAFGKLLAA